MQDLKLLFCTSILWSAQPVIQEKADQIFFGQTKRSISSGFPIVHLFLAANVQLLVIFYRRGHVRFVKKASLTDPLATFSRSFGALYEASEASCSRESQPENSHVLLIWEVSISSFSFSSPADLFVLFLSCCPFHMALLHSLFSLIALFLSSLRSPFAVLSPGLGGSGCRVCGSIGTRTMELPFLLLFPYRISYY